MRVFPFPMSTSFKNVPFLLQSVMYGKLLSSLNILKCTLLMALILLNVGDIMPSHSCERPHVNGFSCKS